MKVITGKVIAGRIVIEGEPLEEGATVTVLAPERDEAFALDAQAEAALLAAMAEADRGEVGPFGAGVQDDAGGAKSVDLSNVLCYDPCRAQRRSWRA
jgi:hypothetical protein